MSITEASVIVGLPLLKQRSAISVPAINRGRQQEENQVPVSGYLARVMPRGESVSALPEAGTFFENQKMRTTTKSRKASTRPIHFPAEAVDLLEEVLAASGTGLTVEQYAAEFLQDEIIAPLATPGDLGPPLMLQGSYHLEPGDFEAMHAVYDRWRTKATTEPATA